MNEWMYTCAQNEKLKKEITVFKQTMSSKILIPKPGGSWQLQGPLEMKQTMILLEIQPFVHLWNSSTGYCWIRLHCGVPEILSQACAIPRWAKFQVSLCGWQTSGNTVLNNSLCTIFYLPQIVSPLPVFTPEGTIGLPFVRPSVCPSVSLSVCQSVCLSVCPLKIWILW